MPLWESNRNNNTRSKATVTENSMMTYGNGIMTHLAEAHCLFCDWNVKKNSKMA